MVSKANLLTAASVLFLVAASTPPALALSVGIGGVSASVGGTSTGGVSATTGIGSTAGVSASVGGGSTAGVSASVGDGITATATVGGGDGNVASATIGTGDTSTSVTVSNNPGNLATVNTDGNTSTADVNLGNLGNVVGNVLGNVDVTTPNDPSTPVDNPTTPAATQVSDTLSSLSTADQDALRIRCKNVMADPAGYTRNVVALCRLIATLK